MSPISMSGYDVYNVRDVNDRDFGELSESELLHDSVVDIKDVSITEVPIEEFDPILLSPIKEANNFSVNISVFIKKKKNNKNFIIFLTCLRNLFFNFTVIY